MATTRDRLYGRFKFLIDLGETGEGAHGGFGEVRGIETDIPPADYRGADESAAARKLPGVSRATYVTLKTGVVDALEFHRWLDDTHIGDRAAARTVTIRQWNEQHTANATWKLVGARIVKHTTGRLNAGGMHVVIEELGLACDSVEIIDA